MRIRFTAFGGGIPRMSPELIPAPNSQVAQNANLLNGKLNGLNINTAIQAAIANCKSIFNLKGSWLQWTQDVDVCLTPLAGDTTGRIYFSGNGAPQMTNFADATTGVGTPPILTYPLGVPMPANATGVESPITGTISGATANPVSGTNTVANYPCVGDPVVITGSVRWRGLSSSRYNTGATMTVTRDGTKTVGSTTIQLSGGGSTAEPEWNVTTAPFNFTDTPPSGNHTYTLSLSYGDMTLPGSISVAESMTVLQQSLTVTLNSTTGLVVGDYLVITGVQGMPQLNGTLQIQSISGANVVVPSTSTDGAYTGGGTWTVQYDTADQLAETRYYVMTQVATQEGISMEGPPNSPIGPLTVYPSEPVVLNLPARSNSSITALNIYRTNPNNSNSEEFQFVTQLAYPWGATYTDTADASTLGEVLSSADYDAPPTNLIGLTTLPNGVIAGFFDNVLCPSVPYLPHAFPIEYQISVEETIVALLPFGGISVAILTNGHPYMVEGSDPSQYVTQRLEATFPCVSKQSAVDMGYAGMYATNEGIVMVDLENGIDIVTRDLWRPEQFAALNPSTFIAGRSHDRYVFFNANSGFMFDPKEPRARLVQLNFVATAAWTDINTGDLYLVVGGEIVKFDDDSASTQQTYSWTSPEFVSEQPARLSVIRVRGDLGTNAIFSVAPAANAQITWTDANQPVPIVAGVGNGSQTSYPITPNGQAYTPNALQLYKSDWQGNQLQYSTPRTNLITNSNNFGAANWTNTNCTTTASATTGPDGTTSGTKLAVANVSNPNITTNDYTVPSPAPASISASVWLKAGNITQAILDSFQNGLGAVAANWVILSGPGSVSGSGTSQGTVTGLNATQWTRVGFTTTGALSPTYLFSLYIKPQTGSPTIGDYIYCAFAQMELGTANTSYIATAGSTVTVTDYSLQSKGPNITVFADGQQVSSAAYTDGNVQRLPVGYLARKFYVDITGTTRVDEVALATSANEIAA